MLDQPPVFGIGILIPKGNDSSITIRKERISRNSGCYPFWIPQRPSSFQPVLVTSRSTSYLAPQTFRVLMYGGCASALPIKEYIFSETASAANFSSSGQTFERTDGGMYPAMAVSRRHEARSIKINAYIPRCAGKPYPK